MLDSDLAELYGVETKRLTEQVRRNASRFPVSFRFQLTYTEWEAIRNRCPDMSEENIRSQIATLESGRGKHRKYVPYVFTEQGVAMLSAVLRSETAIAVSIRIMKTFVLMRKALIAHAPLIKRIEQLEHFKNETNTRIDILFQAIEAKSAIPETGIFFDGEVFDSWVFVSDLIRSAEKSVLLIDNYVDDTILKLFVKRKNGVAITLFTRQVTPQLALEAEKFNQQYGGLTIRQLLTSHDRFMIIDGKELFHIGASLKDLGKKWFAFCKIDSLAPAILSKLSMKA